MTEQAPRNPRGRLDQLLGHKFTLTQQTVLAKIQQLRASNANDNRPGFREAVVGERVATRQRWFRALRGKKLDGVDLTHLMSAFTDGRGLDEWREINRTRSGDSLTPATEARYLREMAEDREKAFDEEAKRTQRNLAFGEAHGAQEIFQTWQAVFLFLHSIADQVESDDEVADRVEATFPEFWANLTEYFVFIRTEPWHHDAEAITLQKQYAKEMWRQMEEEEG